MAPRTLRVFPDAGRVEQALLEASLQSPFVDATGYWSFSQLVAACAPKGTRPLSRLAARFIVAGLVRELPEGPFGPWARDIAFARGAVELFAELETQLATPDQLERASVDAGSARGAWLAKVWHRFKRRKAELEVADSADLLSAATASVRRALPEPLRGFARLELHGVHDLPLARLALLYALDAALPEVALNLPRADNAAVDALVNEVHSELERRHETSKVDLIGDVPDAPFARLRLFSEADAAALAPGLDAFSASTPREEAREIARRVRARLDAGAAPEEIAVVYRELGDEAEALIEALAERGVPSRARRGVPLAATPAGHLALSLPALIEEGFPADAVSRCLSSRYLLKLWEPGSEPGVFFGAAGIRDDRIGAEGERGAYAVRLTALATRFAEGWPKGPADEVRSVARQVERLLAAVEPLREADTLAGHLRAWSLCLERVGLLEGLRTELAPGGDEQALARDQAAADALVALQKLIADSAKTAGVADVRLSRRELSRWLLDAASELNLLVRGPRAGAVSLLEAREVSGRRFRHVFIGGLVDGRFPGRASGGGLLADDDKGALNLAARAPLFRLNVGESGGRLPLRLAEDRLLFYLALCSATETATLSHARGEALGRTFSPSPFLHELQRAAEGFDVRRLPRPLVPAVTEVSSDAELRLRSLLDGAKPAWAEEALALAGMEHQRLRYFSDETRETGVFTGAVASELLGQHFAFDAERPLSAGKLGTFGNCGFAGFLSEVVGLEPAEGQGEDLDSRSKGTLVHAVLEKLLPVLREPAAANLEDVVGLAVDEAASVHERRMPVGHPLLWKLAKAKVVREISALIRSGRVRPVEGVLPEKAEWKFAVELQGVTVGGKVDRVDVGGSAAVVIDYKTGVLKGQVDRVERLLVSEWQLPIYAHAVRAAGLASQVDAALLSTREGFKPLSAIAKQVGVTVDELISTDAAVQERLAREGKPNLGNAVQRLVDGLRAGEFPARPYDCEYCAYRSVCRISTRKLHDEGPR